MSEFYQNGDKIDGNRVHISVKKLDFKGLVTSPTGFMGVKYNCSRDCYSEIVISLDEDKIQEIANNEKLRSIYLEIGDALKCGKLFFVAETKRKLNCFRVTMMSGRHECNDGQPDVRVYAEIQKPFDQIVHAVEKKQKELLSANNPIQIESK